MLKDILVQWNQGIERGAARRFAEKIGVTEATVGRWLHGKGEPFETMLPKIAKELNMRVEELMGLFKENRDQESFNLKKFLTAEEWESLEQVADRDLRDVKGMIRWLVQNYAADRLRLLQSHEIEVFEEDASVKEGQERGGRRVRNRGTADKQRVAGDPGRGQ
jgi:transcriptional regulator with XRE-family HTH domain